MAHVPECDGAVYGCTTCDKRGMTIEEAWAHRAECTHVRTRCSRLVTQRMRDGGTYRAYCQRDGGHTGFCDPTVRH